MHTEKNIIIAGPTFFSAEDEEVFFKCLYSLPEFDSVSGKGLELNIKFKKAIPLDAMQQLSAICRRWEIDISLPK
ncbi:hypothetical protein [Alteromonas flava]|uniref:hypothetical protein n=1 Tax=Alteromonas flava TaxID=2048003 RepID=UPI000F5E7ACF|nr:hypothetical protein [Alteromonas flava]